MSRVRPKDNSLGTPLAPPGNATGHARLSQRRDRHGSAVATSAKLLVVPFERRQHPGLDSALIENAAQRCRTGV